LTDALVEREYVRLVKAGSEPELWAVDDAGRIWLGPRYFDGRDWRTLARDRVTGDTRLTWGDVTLLDPARAMAWVPFRIETDDCPVGRDCVEIGLQAFDEHGEMPGEGFRLEYSAEAEARIPRGLHILAARRQDRGGIAFAPREILDLALADPRRHYPYLEIPDPPGLRNAGFLSAAMRSPDGPYEAALWIELQDQQADPTYMQVLARWSDGDARWLEASDLSASPLLDGDPANNFMVAGDWSADGRMQWFASSNGMAGARDRDGNWGPVFERTAIGMPAGARPLDLALALDDRVWLISDAGVFTYGVRSNAAPIYLPISLRRF
jgi:hypothetical protein